MAERGDRALGLNAFARGQAIIAVDTHILVEAHRAESAFHDEAYAGIQSLPEGARP